MGGGGGSEAALVKAMEAEEVGLGARGATAAAEGSVALERAATEEGSLEAQAAPEAALEADEAMEAAASGTVGCLRKRCLQRSRR